MVRYSVLRLLIFFGCLGLLWLLGLRDRSEQPWLVVGAGILSMVLSYLVLRPFRDQYVADLSAKVERRVASRQAKAATDSDEAIEDATLAGEPRPPADSDYR